MDDRLRQALNLLKLNGLLGGNGQPCMDGCRSARSTQGFSHWTQPCSFEGRGDWYTAVMCRRCLWARTELIDPELKLPSSIDEMGFESSLPVFWFFQGVNRYADMGHIAVLANSSQQALEPVMACGTHHTLDVSRPGWVLRHATRAHLHRHPSSMVNPATHSLRMCARCKQAGVDTRRWASTSVKRIFELLQDRLAELIAEDLEFNKESM